MIKSFRYKGLNSFMRRALRKASRPSMYRSSADNWLAWKWLQVHRI